MPRKSKNINGYPLKSCSKKPLTGFYRDGYCHTGSDDIGTHTVCAEMTQDFLQFTKKKGNNLSDPNPNYGFPGLNPGDKWCLCANRWKEAHQNNRAPPVYLNATNQATLKYVDENTLRKKAKSQTRKNYSNY